MAVGLGVLIRVVVGVAVGMVADVARGVGLTVGSAPAQAVSIKTLNTETMTQIAHTRIGKIIG